MTPLAATEALQQVAGPVGLLLVVLLAVATVLLIRNMDRRLKRLPREFPPAAAEPAAPGDPDVPRG